MIIILRSSTSKNFWKKENKVKVTIQFRGREMAHKEMGWELIKRIKRRT